jgi:hypothetical protein
MLCEDVDWTHVSRLGTSGFLAIKMHILTQHVLLEKKIYCFSMYVETVEVE